jgi:hypothetical protein
METKQPIWKLVAQLGDVHPIDYGGHFVFEDETGVYPPEAEILLVQDDTNGEPTEWLAYRYSLDKLAMVDGYLVNARFVGRDDLPHPIASYDEWFHRDLDGCAANISTDTETLRRMFCSDDIRERARAYEFIGGYHGFDNLDGYPLAYTSRTDVEQRYRAHPYLNLGSEGVI